ncbi:hypothetical protein SCA6_019380 [Theobroma cacao]
MILEVVFGTLMALRGKVMQKARKGRQEREQPTGRTYVWLSGCRIGPAFRTDISISYKLNWKCPGIEKPSILSGYRSITAVRIALVAESSVAVLQRKRNMRGPAQVIPINNESSSDLYAFLLSLG